MNIQFPLNIGKLDHYTSIVENAEIAINFYLNILGFNLIKKQGVNTTGTTELEYDMMNYILEHKQNEGVTCVVTEGLTDDTIFRQYIKKYGSGIHHMAYTIERIDDVFEMLKKNNIELTSNEVIYDPLTGLKQVFISRIYTGYFIELIERINVDEYSVFVENNMRDLAKTIRSFV